MTGPYLCLVLSEKDFHRAYDDLAQDKAGRPPWILNDHSNATCHTLLNKRGDLAAVVALRGWQEKEGIQIACLLLHEAVHIWQCFRIHIGEHQPSAEFEAYSIQFIAQQLMYSFKEQTSKAQP